MCTRVYQSRDLLMLDACTLRDFVTPILSVLRQPLTTTIGTKVSFLFF